ncbi:MAG: hypothetical protein ACOY3Z_01865 [Thermodesulfobacteriota bacterium]
MECRATNPERQEHETFHLFSPQSNDLILQALIPLDSDEMAVPNESPLEHLLSAHLLWLSFKRFKPAADPGGSLPNLIPDLEHTVQDAKMDCQLFIRMNLHFLGSLQFRLIPHADVSKSSMRPYRQDGQKRGQGKSPTQTWYSNNTPATDLTPKRSSLPEQERHTTSIGAKQSATTNHMGAQYAIHFHNTIPEHHRPRPDTTT